MIRKDSKFFVILFIIGVFSIGTVVVSTLIGDFFEKISVANILFVLGFIAYIIILFAAVWYLSYRLVLLLVALLGISYISISYIFFDALFHDRVMQLNLDLDNRSYGFLMSLMEFSIFSIGMTILFLLLKKAVVAIKKRSRP
jgi:hypothetical protein